MRKQVAKDFFDICAEAYVETKTRKKIQYPRWINDLKNDRESAERAFVAIQAWLLVESRNIKLNTGEGKLHPIEEAQTALQNNLKYLDPESQSQIKGKSVSRNWRHSLVTEAGLRDPAVVTPLDVTELMVEQTKPNSAIDVYAVNGLGLRYAVNSDRECNLVGDEFGKGGVHLYPKDLEKINDEIETWYRHQEFINRQFLDLDWAGSTGFKRSESLLINAIKCLVPFGNKDEANDQPDGELNKCLEAGYQTVVALVSNHALTAGRGVAARVFNYCIKKGLRKIIQLPMGVLGYKSQQHSILVFGAEENKEAVQFINLAIEENIGLPKKGFGEPRRASSLRARGDGYWGSQFKEKTITVDVQQIKNQKKLISFEVGQYLSLQEDSVKELRKQYEFTKLNQFVEIFRSHHMEEIEESKISEYFEIGAGNINETGWIIETVTRQTTDAALEKRNSQILRDGDLVMCFRGSPDSFGKVGIYRKNNNAKSIPNQSFVILRMKDNVMNQYITPEYILIWLRSKYAKAYLKSKSISPDVMRVAPKAIGEMEIPSGPLWQIEKEGRMVLEIFNLMEEIERRRLEIHSIEKKVWLVNE